MRNGIAVRLLTLFAAGTFLACEDDGPEPDRYEATLSGASEVPANDSDATGSFTLTDHGGSMSFRLNVEDIASATMAHIHAGAPGVNGGIIVPLFSTTTPNAMFSGTLAADDFDAGDIVALPGSTTPISLDSLRVLLRTNGAYVNVHTVARPPGEIRGQVVRR